MGWALVGNIKGPPGTIEIPDPLDVETTINLGSNSRIVALVNGLRIQVKDSNGDWQTQVQWTEAMP